MKHRFKHRGKIGLMVLGAVFLVGLFTMVLWNSLLPSIFGLPEIGIFQALGLLILFRLFFGGFGGRGHWGREGRHMMWRKKWEGMSKEERKAFRSKSWGWGKHHSEHSHCKHSHDSNDESEDTGIENSEEGKSDSDDVDKKESGNGDPEPKSV